MFRRSLAARTVAALVAALAAGVACGSSAPAAVVTPHTHAGMDMSKIGDGLAATNQGYTLDSPVTALPPGNAQDYTFRILGPDGAPLTRYIADQTKFMHFYAVRRDLAVYQHLHPTMADDGTWSVALPLTEPGPWRVYASFVAKTGGSKNLALVLSRDLMVTGDYQAQPLPAAAAAADVDGYTVALSGPLMGAMSMPLTAHVTWAGQPVNDLEPYLDAYAHLTAFRSTDLAFAHMHPGGAVASGAHGGPDLVFQATVPDSGDYRIFLQFQTHGQLHTVALTTHVA